MSTHLAKLKDEGTHIIVVLFGKTYYWFLLFFRTAIKTPEKHTNPEKKRSKTTIKNPESIQIYETEKFKLQKPTDVGE